MPQTSVQTVYVLLSQGIVSNEAAWYSCELPVITLESLAVDGNPRRRLADVKLSMASYAIIDGNGYMIKRPPAERIGKSCVRLFADGMDWLKSVSKPVTRDGIVARLTAFNEQHSKGKTSMQSHKDIMNTLHSNPVYESPAYKDFCKHILPKGIETQL